MFFFFRDWVFKVLAGRTSRRLAAAVLAAGLALAVGCAATSKEEEHRMPENAASAAAQLPAASDGVEKLSASDLAPVYWLRSSNEGVYLYREYVHTDSPGDPITDAVLYMLNNTAGKDDWFTYLKPASEIGVSISPDNLITLDMPKRVFTAKLDQGLAERSVQQLVFTSTAAAANAGLLADGVPAKVRILVDGTANATVFQDYRLESEYQRDASLMAPIWIIDPQHGSKTSNTEVKLFARSIPFSDGIHYSMQRRDSSGTWVAWGEPERVDPSERAADGTITRELQLTPGDYRLTMWGQNTGSGNRIAATSSRFTVR